MALTRTRSSETPGLTRLGFQVSIILNLFFLALIGGFFLRPIIFAHQTDDPIDRAIALVEGQLGPSDAAAFDAIMTRDKAQNTEAKRQLISSRDALESELAVEPFDQARAKVAVANTRQAFDRFIEGFSATVLDALNQLSPAGRKRLVELRRQHLGTFDPVSPSPAGENH
jgi:hypothetical protein